MRPMSFCITRTVTICRTVDGTLVSDNEFADMGLYESEENVENGTEHILPFTDYGSDVESACDLEDEEDLEI